MRRLRLFLLVVLGLLLWAGCSRNEDYPYATETDEPAYQRGKELEKQGREQEALSEFLKVIAKRGEDAPESHIEVATIYEQHIKDPIAAIYHYRKFLELRPNDPKADLARQHIAACMREFARTLPGQPLGVGLPQPDLTDVVARLQKENDDLRAELAAVRSPQSAPAREAVPDTSPPAASIESPVTVAPPAADDSAPPVITRAPPAPEPVRPAPVTAASGRVHTVVKGDTLYNISQRYYGTRSKWRDIYNANRDVMKSENDLKIGTQLKIP
ncbi:MAG TPA: LysM peptidoglycan-binding domain-containing protein [Opitutaceae bacterium]|nr:LysM peptidoglycan-binding domain-containing protein [Opitutaceae bacterium]